MEALLNSNNNKNPSINGLFSIEDFEKQAESILNQPRPPAKKSKIKYKSYEDYQVKNNYNNLPDIQEKA